MKFALTTFENCTEKEKEELDRPLLETEEVEANFCLVAMKM